ncbi:hypothetical protein BsWGS_26566 [Bradybaena similaris]
MLPPLAKMSNDVVPQASISKPRFLPRESLKRDSYLKPQFGSDPAKKLFKHMHRMSMKAQARVKDGRVSKTAIVEVSESSSAMTVSSLSDKVKPPVTRKGLIVGDEEEKRVVPPYLLDEDVSGAFERRNLKAYTQSLVDRSREINNQGRITAIFKYNQRIIYTLKPVNYSATPASALKVQWRISRSLLTPSFIMVFSMLNRYGTVVALIKRSSNSAMCIFETVDQAQRAINMHSLNQSSKILILSWWHQMLGSATFITTFSGLTKEHSFPATQEFNHGRPKEGANQVLGIRDRTGRQCQHSGNLADDLDSKGRKLHKRANAYIQDKVRPHQVIQAA